MMAEPPLRFGQEIPVYKQLDDLNPSDSDAIDNMDKKYAQPIANLRAQLPDQTREHDLITSNTGLIEQDILGTNERRIKRYERSMDLAGLRFWEKNKFKAGFCPRIGVYLLGPPDKPKNCSPKASASILISTGLYNVIGFPIFSTNSGSIETPLPDEGESDPIVHEDEFSATTIILTRVSPTQVRISSSDRKSGQTKEEIVEGHVVGDSSHIYCVSWSPAEIRFIGITVPVPNPILPNDSRFDWTYHSGTLIGISG